MTQKRAIKVITLFDIIVNNKNLLMATIYELVVLLFLYYSKRNMNNISIKFPDNKDIIQTVTNNLTINQNISLITLILQGVIKNSFTDVNTREKHLQLLLLNIFIKSILCLIQIDNNSLINSSKIFNSMNYTFISYTYTIQLVIAISSLTFGLMSLFLCCILVLQEILYDIGIILTNFLKKYKFHYIQYNEVPNVEDV